MQSESYLIIKYNLLISELFFSQNMWNTQEICGGVEASIYRGED